MQIILNGETRQIPDGANAERLIELLELQGRRLAIEINGEILPRSGYPERTLRAGDRVEIVHAVGGG